MRWTGAGMFDVPAGWVGGDHRSDGRVPGRGVLMLEWLVTGGGSRDGVEGEGGGVGRSSEGSCGFRFAGRGGGLWPWGAVR